MANTAIQVTDLDFQEIKASLKNFLASQSEFTDYDFTGSGLNTLLDVLAYNTHYNAYYLNMIANESFMDTAVLRNSVVSHAKKYGYVPRSTTSPVAFVNITLTPSGSYTADSYTIPKYTQFSTEVDGNVYKFLADESKQASKSSGTFTFNNLKLREGDALTFSRVVDTAQNPNLVFDIPDENVDTSTLIVSVKESSVSSNITVWNLATDSVYDIISTSEVYYLQEGQDSKYQIYFGDGNLSKTLVDGNIVSITYFTTNGAAANYANTFSITSSLSGIESSSVTGSIAAAGGATRETVDEIKFNAPLNLLSQNRAVTKNDYIRLIKQKYPAFEAVNVWGGEENDPPVYGKVFITAKPRLGYRISQTEKDYVVNKIIKPISVLTVTPEIVDIDYNYLKIQTEVVYEKNKTTLSDSEMKQNLKNVILNFTNSNLNSFNTYFKYSALEALIDNYSKSIISNEVEITVAKKFRPSLTATNSYVLDFGMELKKGGSTGTLDSIYSTPTFNVRDENGVSRQCFFEEIPASYTGVESITVTNPGFNYTSTPVVTIVGDGTGATARANIVNGKLSSITVLTPGIGYTTAAVQITGGAGTSGAGSAVLEGRYGSLRLSYYKTDEISSQSTKVVINSNINDGVTGTIDYTLGKITINNFSPIAVNNDFGDILIHAKPKSNIIQSKFNKMLVLDPDDSTSITVITTQV